MFHVEHNLHILSEKTGISDPDKLSVLHSYAEMIFNENEKFNLTGHKTFNEIIDNLIACSLEPFADVNVPRGTFFADLGTGAGIPGIPLAIKYPEISGILFDSNSKKTGFIERAAKMLRINNIKTANLRIEDAGKLPEFREMFDLVVTRAMSDLYIVAELGSPLLKTGGCLYYYTNIKKENIGSNIYRHLDLLGIEVKDFSEGTGFFKGACTEGLLLIKIKRTGERFPRRMAVIKRMAERDGM
jgi:16S rRNA (guanine527-N7)-methyltransferase